MLVLDSGVHEKKTKCSIQVGYDFNTQFAIACVTALAPRFCSNLFYWKHTVSASVSWWQFSLVHLITAINRFLTLSLTLPLNVNVRNYMVSHYILIVGRHYIVNLKFDWNFIYEFTHVSIWQHRFSTCNIIGFCNVQVVFGDRYLLYNFNGIKRILGRVISIWHLHLKSNTYVQILAMNHMKKKKMKNCRENFVNLLVWSRAIFSFLYHDLCVYILCIDHSWNDW